MNTLIIGGGAIGSLLVGKLTASSLPVTMIGRPSWVEALRSQGLVITSPNGNCEVTHPIAAASIAEAYELLHADISVVILTVKSYDTQDALQELAATLAHHGVQPPVVLSLQNGIGNEEAIAGMFGSSHVIAGTITTPVSVMAPGIIHVDRPRFVVGLSPWHPAVPNHIFNAVQQALMAAGFSITVYADARSMKWTKLLMNMVGNATSAILDMPPSEIFADKMLVDVEIQAWREALRVMQATGIAPVNIGNYPFAMLAPLIRRLPKSSLRGVLRKRVELARGGKMPSLQIDLQAGKERSEIHWLNGAVVKAGAKLNVATPINRVLTDTLASIIGDEQKRALWRGNHLRLIVTVDEYVTREREARA